MDSRVTTVTHVHGLSQSHTCHASELAVDYLPGCSNVIRRQSDLLWTGAQPWRL